MRHRASEVDLSGVLKSMGICMLRAYCSVSTGGKREISHWHGPSVTVRVSNQSALCSLSSRSYSESQWVRRPALNNVISAIPQPHHYFKSNQCLDFKSATLYCKKTAPIKPGLMSANISQKDKQKTISTNTQTNKQTMTLMPFPFGLIPRSGRGRYGWNFPYIWHL